MDQQAIKRKFAAALEGLVEQMKEDRTVLAALLCGSLAHDTVWARSDVDLVLITADDRHVEPDGLALYADGVNVHAILMSRAEFRRTVEGSMRNSFMHSFLAKGRLLYTRDPTIADLCDGLQALGTRDAAVQLLRAASAALASIDKAHKWFVTRGDLDYTALWILYAATPLAGVELIRAGQLVDREVLPKALALNPEFFTVIYSGLLNERKTRSRVQAALDAVDAYVAGLAPVVFAPVIDHLRAAGEPRSCRELEDHFKKNFDVSDVTTVCEYLANLELLGKAAVPAHVTRRSNVEVQELAFFYMSEPADAR